MYPTGVRLIIWICAIFYLLQHMYYPLVDNLFGLAYIGNDNFRIFQFATYGFLHSDMHHIFINMLMLVIFGSRLEHSLGIRNFLALFVAAVICGGAAQMAANMMQLHNITGTVFPVTAPTDLFNHIKLSIEYGNEYAKDFASVFNRVTVGASAGVFGCMLAFTCMFPRQRLGLPFIPISISARILIVVYVISELYMVLYSPAPQIAHHAHLGGAAAGLLLALYWKKTPSPKNNA